MNAERPELSVVIPAYHEEENLRVLLPRLKATLNGSGLTYEVLVIDTQKPLDNTREVCREWGVSYIARRGSDKFGDAIRTGLAEARGVWILFMDGDGSHTPEFIPQLLAEREGKDVVIASRYVPGGYTENNRVLVFMSHVVNVVYRVVLGLRCKDVSNNFKLYRAELVKGLSLRCDNFDIVEEMLYKISRENPGVRIVEVPFSFKQRMFGKTKRNLFVFMVSYLFTLIRLRLQR
ncbi:MAG: glycosyltransferase [bacterium]|nr:glycosyltransferase [bacterium]